MKTTLIFLGSLAVVLGIFAYFAVFGPPTGSYAITPLGGATDTGGVSSSLLGVTIATSTSLSGVNSSSSASSTAGANGNDGGSGTFGSAFATPALSWPEGQSKISITALSLQATQMTFTLSVQTGAAPECVPLNLRLVADEQGDLDPPNPASFTFPDSGSCNGAPGQTYANQTTTFSVDPTQLPLLFTTGGASNIFFEVATSTGDGLSVDFPGTNG